MSQKAWMQKDKGLTETSEAHVRPPTLTCNRRHCSAAHVDSAQPAGSIIDYEANAAVVRQSNGTGVGETGIRANAVEDGSGSNLVVLARESRHHTRVHVDVTDYAVLVIRNQCKRP